MQKICKNYKNFKEGQKNFTVSLKMLEEILLKILILKIIKKLEKEQLVINFFLK